MRHNLPPTPAFQDMLPTDPIQEVALRVIVELPGWEMHVIGTAVLILEKLFELGEGRIRGRLAQLLSRLYSRLFGKMPLKPS
jgi:hypothetical protein